MERTRHFPRQSRKGSVLILSLIFVVMFSAMAVAMASMSGANVQLAENQRKLDNTRGCAESGLEVVRYWMSKVAFSGTTSPGQRFNQVASSLQSELTNAGITNIVPVLGASTITISNVPLSSSGNQSFTAVLTKINDNSIQLDVTGHYGSLTRTLRSTYTFTTRAHTVFDFGVASKGPISLSGNIELTGININIESNAYIESANNLLALSIIGNSQIAGRVKIVNPSAYVYLQGGQAGIGGVNGTEATLPPYTEIGAASTEFPEMNPSQFYSYATNVLSPTANLSANATYENLIIPAGMNPHFSGQATLKGVIYVQAPNVVTFSGGVNMTGIIVTDGSPTDDSGVNRLEFTGTVNSLPISQLPQQPQFQGLHDKLGTFILAPGFRSRFGGAFGALCGAIASNGIEFWGNAGGTINGSIINYSNAAMSLGGNSDLYFNRSGLTEVPAGFVPETIMRYNPSSYSEVIL